MAHDPPSISGANIAHIVTYNFQLISYGVHLDIFLLEFSHILKHIL